jgi:DUF4097 and DUF4098 domain-containing protein YvlB
MKPSHLIVAVVATLIVSSAAADTDLREEHTFDAHSGQTVVIEASFHRIEVEVVPGDAVHAVVEISSSSSSGSAERVVEELRPVFAENADSLIIRSTRQGGRSWRTGRIDGRISVTMPPDLDLSVASSSGSITVNGDLGDAVVTCSASSGSVTVDGAMRELRASTSSGSIRAAVDRPLERFSASASSGSVRLSGGAFWASVDTSSGGITLGGLRGGAEMSASSGAVRGHWDVIPPGATIKAGASSGGVTLELPPGTELTGDVSTGSGGIRSDFPGTFDRGHATFDGGEGAVEIRVSTGSGSVKLVTGS